MLINSVIFKPSDFWPLSQKPDKPDSKVKEKKRRAVGCEGERCDVQCSDLKETVQLTDNDRVDNERRPQEESTAKKAVKRVGTRAGKKRKQLRVGKPVDVGASTSGKLAKRRKCKAADV